MAGGNIEEFDIVTVISPTAADNNLIVTAGTEATVVAILNDGDTYIIEYSDGLGSNTAIVSKSFLKAS